MTLPQVKKFPLDLTGTHPDNLIVDEEITLVIRKIRGFTPQYAPFFSDSVIITDVSTGRQLEKDVDYRISEIIETPTALTGKEVSAVIFILNESVSGKILVSYQVIGGDYQYLESSLLKLIEALDIDDRPILWELIINKPDSFMPGMHLHDIGDIYGFEYVVNALNRIRDAILMSQALGYDLLLKYIDELVKAIKPEDLGLGNIKNFPIATEPDIVSKPPSNEHYTTPESIKIYVEKVHNTEADPHPQYILSDEILEILKAYSKRGLARSYSFFTGSF